jgi:sulfate/thiosulfate transport system substrate-binding protein
MKTRIGAFWALATVCGLVALWGIIPGCKPSAKEVKLVNVSYDPTREFYKEVNSAFEASWKKQTGETISAKTSHGGSRMQAGKVIEGLETDVVTLALSIDIDLIQKKAGLLAADWQSRLPNNSCPYTSTIVFLVRKGNPKKITDWGDLVNSGVEIVTPNPKTSGGACWNYLAAWGYVLKRELKSFDKLKDPKAAEEVAQANDKAKTFVKDLFAHVVALDSGARGSTKNFVQNGVGDVLLAWENEAFLSLKEKDGAEKFEIVVPSISILAEPPVAIVDKMVDKRGTRKLAEAYLNFLYAPEGQTLAAKHFYRPSNTKNVPEEYLKRFGKVELFTVNDVFGGWEKAQKEHFDKGGVYDQIAPSK